MKRIIKTLISFVLVSALIMSLGVFAYADSAELPVEKVSYGYGCPESAAVDMHALLPDNITIDGFDIELRSDNGTLYIRVTDLAAAKLLREGAEKLAELGLDASMLYIKDGNILVKEDGLTEEELKEANAKLSSFLKSVLVKVDVGDTFTLANAGSAALIVEISGFILPPESESAEDEAAPAEAPEEKPESKLHLDVQPASVTSQRPCLPSSRPVISTVYVSFSATAYYSYSSETYTFDKNMEYSAYSGKIFLVKAENDTAEYTVKIGNDNEQEMNDCGDYIGKKTDHQFNSSSSIIKLDLSTQKEITLTISSSEAPGESKTITFNDKTPEITGETIAALHEKKDDADRKYNESVSNSSNDHTIFYDVVSSDPSVVDRDKINSVDITSADEQQPIISEAEKVNVDVAANIEIKNVSDEKLNKLLGESEEEESKDLDRPTSDE